MGQKIDSMQSKLARVRGLGSAKDGTHHWWMQRITALALIPLLVWFVGSMMAILGNEQQMIVQWLQYPWNGILTGLFLIVGIYHGTLGMQVVVEDYVHGHAMKYALLIAMKFIMVLAITMVFYALAKIAFMPVYKG